MGKVESATAGLRPLYSFDQLVVGAHNQTAVAVCQEVLKLPGETYNPLFVYGPPGVGKTHLMQAVAHEMLQKNPGFKVKYISAERFMSEVLTAIAEERMLEVRRTYSTIDLLILDDVQYLTESKISQEELFHVFNNLHQANKQVILAADRPPNQLSQLNSNIKTRLEWGLSVDVKVPDEAARLQILERKQQQLPGLHMDEVTLIYVSRALNSNVRELEGFLKRIHAYVTLSHQQLSLDLVKAVVREILPEGAPDPVVDLDKKPAAHPVTNGHANGTPKPVTNGYSAPVAAVPAPAPVAPPPDPVAPPPAPITPAAPVAAPVAAPEPIFVQPAPPTPPSPPPTPVVEPPLVVSTKPPAVMTPDNFFGSTEAPPVPQPVVAQPATPNSVKDGMAFEVLLQGMGDAPPTPPAPAPAPSAFFDLEMDVPQEQKAVANMSAPAPVAPAPVKPAQPVMPDLQVVLPPEPEAAPVGAAVPEAEIPMEEEDLIAGHKDIGAVFFYPETMNEQLECVHRKFQEVIKKHKLKFRLRRVHSEPYAYKGKINYSSFVDVCKNNKVPVAIVIGPPPDSGAPQQDFYDLLTVTLDVQGVSLQLVNWSEINKDYRYLNLALDIALVRSR